MKLIYKEKPSGFTGKHQIRAISWWEKEFCCRKMRKAWDVTLIGVDESGLVADKKPVCLHWEDVSEGETDHSYYSINYCPFCGEQIIYVELP